MDLPNLRKSSGTGDGFMYFNSYRNTYEGPRSMTLIPKSKLTALETRSASIASSAGAVNKNKNNTTNNRQMPAHMRLHQIYGLCGIR